jgi:hypothetical protein
LGTLGILMAAGQMAAATPSFLTSVPYLKPGSNRAQTLGPWLVDLNHDGILDLPFFDLNAQAVLAERVPRY